MTDDIQAELRLKGRVELDDVIIEYRGEWMLLEPGDTYIAKHGDDNPEILTVRRVEVQKRLSGLTSGKVFSKERKKRLYDLHECVRVVILENPNPTKVKPVEPISEEKNDESGKRDRDDEVGAGTSDKANLDPNRGRTREDRRAGRTDYTKAAADRVPPAKPGVPGPPRRKLP